MEEITEIELGKTYKCETCGKEDIAKETCYGVSFFILNGKVKCLDCDMHEFFSRYGTAND